MRVGGNEVVRSSVQVREIATSTTGDQNLLTYPVGVFQHQDAPVAFAGFDSAHQARSTRSNNNRVVLSILTNGSHAVSSLAGEPGSRMKRRLALPALPEAECVPKSVAADMIRRARQKLIIRSAKRAVS
jgi:hypothetical protein